MGQKCFMNCKTPFKQGIQTIVKWTTCITFISKTTVAQQLKCLPCKQTFGDLKPARNILLFKGFSQSFDIEGFQWEKKCKWEMVYHWT